MMSKEEKRNVMIVIGVIAIGIILYLLWKNNAAIITGAAPSATPSGDNTSPTYTNYNVPAYNPDLGSIFPPAGTNVYNTGGSCDCGTAQCGDSTIGAVTTTEQFNAMMVAAGA